MVLSQINNELITVYVELLDEGTDTWRATKALRVGDNIYRLLPTSNYDPEDESWAFLPEEIVSIEQNMRQGELLNFVVMASP